MQVLEPVGWGIAGFGTNIWNFKARNGD